MKNNVINMKNNVTVSVTSALLYWTLLTKYKSVKFLCLVYVSICSFQTFTSVDVSRLLCKLC